MDCRIVKKPAFTVIGSTKVINVPEGSFKYMIADDYIPAKEMPKEFETVVIPENTWAVFLLYPFDYSPTIWKILIVRK